jgi:hypothetical protein
MQEKWIEGGFIGKSTSKYIAPPIQAANAARFVSDESALILRSSLFLIPHAYAGYSCANHTAPTVASALEHPPATCIALSRPVVPDHNQIEDILKIDIVSPQEVFVAGSSNIYCGHLIFVAEIDLW